MDINKIISRAKHIIITPKDEWENIKSEKSTPKEILIGYVLPFVVLAAITRFIGYYALYSYASVSSAIRTSLIYLITPLLGITITSYVIFYLADQFHSKKDINKSFQLVGFSYTASLLAAIITNFSPIYLSWVGIFGLYSLYLFWIGLPKMLETPEEKKVPYVLVSIVVLIIINIAIGWLLARFISVF